MTKAFNKIIDTNKGFDCLNRAGKVVKHFGTYEDAMAYFATRRGLTLRYWVKMEQ